ncbi:MAG: thiamine pyrophosphate-dependent enzyme [Phycisphaerae bacterium]
MSVLTTRPGDMGFCQGCSHGLVLEHIAKAIDRMGLGPEQVCFVSDIGCIGISDRYFASHTFHGLHGRSITYAEGIKRVQPELMVIVLIGDGGCGIGTGHLVHAARRGVGIKVLVCNNFNFGMTGGQHSVTTPPCALTATTPSGAVDAPLDICGTVAANGASHIARFSAYDPDCSQHIEAALRSPGFALVDIWELCTAYYLPQNKLFSGVARDTAKMSQRLNMPFGVMRDQATLPTPIVNRQPSPLRASVPSCLRAFPKQSPIHNPQSPLSWCGRTEICMAGSAGQRIRSAAGVIGEIAVSGGLFASQRDDFPITVRRGFSISDLIIDRGPIRYYGLDDPLLVVILSQDGVDRLGGLGHLSPQCHVLADQAVTLPDTRAAVERIDFKGYEKAVGKASAALAVLAHGLVRRGWIEAESLVTSADVCLAGRFRDQNIQAIQAGACGPPQRT